MSEERVGSPANTANVFTQNWGETEKPKRQAAGDDKGEQELSIAWLQVLGGIWNEDRNILEHFRQWVTLKSNMKVKAETLGWCCLGAWIRLYLKA